MAHQPGHKGKRGFDGMNTEPAADITAGTPHRSRNISARGQNLTQSDKAKGGRRSQRSSSR